MRTLALDIGNTAVKAGCFDGAAAARNGTPASRRPGAGAGAALAAAARHCGLGGGGGGAGRGGAAALVPGQVLAFSPAPRRCRCAMPTPRPTPWGPTGWRRPWARRACGPGQDTLIIDAGTALKLDLVTADGTYHGGSIAPGLAMRLRALHAFTGRLPLLAAARRRCNDSAGGRLHYREPAERRGERHGGRNHGLNGSVPAAVPRAGGVADRGRCRVSGGPAPGSYLCRARAGAAWA